MFSVKRRVLAVGAALALLGGAGVAQAGWMSDGSGDGPAAASTGLPLTVRVASTGVEGLYPGATVAVAFSVRNENAYAVTLQSARPHDFEVDPAHADCLDAPDVVRGEPIALHGNLAAGTWSTRHFVRITMSRRAGDACKGARFTFRVDVRAVSTTA